MSQEWNERPHSSILHLVQVHHTLYMYFSYSVYVYMCTGYHVPSLILYCHENFGLGGPKLAAKIVPPHAINGLYVRIDNISKV